MYVFSNNNAPNLRESGVPELTTRLRASFDLNPQWMTLCGIPSTRIPLQLKCKMALLFIFSLIFNVVTLCSHPNRSTDIYYLQLPIGAARPFISEIDDQ